MEKINSVSVRSNSLNDHSFIDSRSEPNRVMKDSTNRDCSWGSGENIGKDSDGDLVISGLSWPPRCYTCTFCKREFRSAQALGGHMNVHRRDRAMLRQMTSSQSFSSNNSPLLNLNLHPNPNFSPRYCSNLSPTTPTLTHSYARLNSSTMQPPYRFGKGGENLTLMESHMPGVGFCKYHGLPRDDQGKIAKNSEIVRWNLESRLLGESKSDDLDLELRLGCA